MNKFSDPLLKTIAVLHDVIEDSNITARNLLEKGVPEEAVNSVVILTRLKGEKYFDFIRRIINSNNKSAIMVKIKDIKHNPNRPENIPDSLIERYEKALAMLQGPES